MRDPPEKVAHRGALPDAPLYRVCIRKIGRRWEPVNVLTVAQPSVGSIFFYGATAIFLSLIILMEI